MGSQSVSVNTALIQESSIYTGQGGCCDRKFEQDDAIEKAQRTVAEKKRQEELEERFNRGWEMWVSKMNGDTGDGSSYNFEAEELAVRLGTRVDKAGKLHAKILLQKIYHFWHCKQHTDMVLVAGPAREEVHLHMFLAHTEFYEKVVMIPDSEKMWKEGKLVLDMTGLVMPKALKTIVSYVYTGAIKLTLDNVTDIAMAAKAMGLRRLQHQCTEFLDYIFSDFHLFTILRNVPVEHKFFDVTWTKILKRFRKVCCESGFLDMEVNQLELLIASDKLDIESEYQAFKPVLEWINHDRRRREQYFFKLMAQIRFAYMDLEELIACMQDEDLFRTNPEAQKILEDADMYATMESMGDQWSNYPPWPPRNDVIRAKIEQRRGKLARLRPKTKAEICNESLPCNLQTKYGCRYDPNADSGHTSTPIEDSARNRYGPANEQAERELFGLTDKIESYKQNQNQLNRKVLVEGKDISTNRTQLLAQLRTATLAAQMDRKKPADMDQAWSGGTDYPYTEMGSKPTIEIPLNSALRESYRYGNGFRQGPSEISLPSCMLTNRKP